MAATVVEKAFCVLGLAKTNSVTLVRRHFRRRYGKPPPTRQSICDWRKKFQETGCLSLLISFQYNIKSVYFFYSNPVLGNTLSRIRQTHYCVPRNSTHVPSVLNTSLQRPKRVVTVVSTPHVRAPTLLLLLDKGY